MSCNCLLGYSLSGFINIHLKRSFVSKLLSKLLINGVTPPPLTSRKRVCQLHCPVYWIGPGKGRGRKGVFAVVRRF